MALRDYESFDNLQSGTTAPGNAFTQKGWSYGGNSPWIEIGGGRFGTDCFRDRNNNVYAYKTYDNQPTWIIGAAFFSRGADGYDGVFQFYDDTTPGYQLTLILNANKLEVRRGNWAGTLLGTGTKTLVNNVFYYIEIKATFHTSTGSVEVRVNEATDINLSGINTAGAGAASASRVILGDLNGGGTQPSWDDYYACDGTGSAPFNTFLGDVRVCSLRPSGNGNSSQLLGSDGNSTDNYLLVDEPGDVDIADYVQSGTVSQKDTYAMTDLPSATGTVYAVKPVMVVTKDDAGSRSAASVIRLSATEQDSANHSLSTSYEWVQDIRTAKPGGGTWTVSDVNSMEVGMKVTA